MSGAGSIKLSIETLALFTMERIKMLIPEYGMQFSHILGNQLRI